jgi:hypothetical protein
MTDLHLMVAKSILNLFGQASGLQCNLSKSSVAPIQCLEAERLLTMEILFCSAKNFPCTYLGLPLSIHKPPKEALQLLVDKVSDYLPGWKASLMNLAGRLIMVRAVLTASPIYSMLAIDLPKWAIKAADKIRRGFGRNTSAAQIIGVSIDYRVGWTSGSEGASCCRSAGNSGEVRNTSEAGNNHFLD